MCALLSVCQCQCAVDFCIHREERKEMVVVVMVAMFTSLY